MGYTTGFSSAFLLLFAIWKLYASVLVRFNKVMKLFVSTSVVCHQRLGPAPHFWHSEERPSLTFFISHMADLSLSTQTVSRRLLWGVQQFLSRVSILTVILL